MNTDYIVEENCQKFIYIKVNSCDALNNMKSGTWWFRHPAFFQYEECKNNDSVRGDAEDSLIYSLHSYDFSESPKIKCRIKLNRYDDEIDKTRILCLYKLAIDSDGYFKEIDSRIESLGTHFSFVNISEFENQLKLQNINFEAKEISYLNENYSGDVGAFGKRFKYAYQNEYRIVISDDKYLAPIKKDSVLQAKLQELSKEIVNQLPPSGSHEARINAYDRYRQLEVDIIERKKDYYDEIYTASNIITEPKPIDYLYNSNNIYEILK